MDTNSADGHFQVIKDHILVSAVDAAYEGDGLYQLSLTEREGKDWGLNSSTAEEHNK